MGPVGTALIGLYLVAMNLLFLALLLVTWPTVRELFTGLPDICASRKFIALRNQRINLFKPQAAHSDDGYLPVQIIQLCALSLGLQSVADQAHPSPMKDVFAFTPIDENATKKE